MARGSTRPMLCAPMAPHRKYLRVAPFAFRKIAMDLHIACGVRPQA
jgi:hypothetical protein